MAERVGFEPTVPCGTPDFECGMRTVLIGGYRAKSVRMLCITGTSGPLCGRNGPTLLAGVVARPVLAH